MAIQNGFIQIIQDEKRDYQYEEAMKTLRTNIQFSGNGLKVIMLTSAMPDEGKSETSFQLAISMAQTEGRVLFIDADIRKSVLVSRFGGGQQIYGLTQYLTGQRPLGEVLYHTNLPNLDIIFSGPMAPNPAELLSEDAFSKLIAWARNEYDTIIIDTPPLGMDIMGGLVGCTITVLLLPFVGTAIYLASPGPIFFAQERVGKNGKRFKMYKFRSMYMDAEARKAELMKDNRLGDGKMFKLDFDPRVIGNKILPDGSHKTGIGDFIRRTSLDEFPQFFNVLKGDMSIVGTRPPLISETNLYELHHKARLAIKPGITGMWQVSGRSDITDFEEVVRLDREYISNWNIGMDIKILVKTVMVVLKEDGSM